MIWAETQTNPCVRVIDTKAIADLAHNNRISKILFVVDHTVLTSYFQRPLELGADVVMYSMTKYMNGHNDVVMGALVMNDKTLYDQYFYARTRYGSVPSSFDCYLVNRSLKTLPLRMEQHNKNAMAIAEYSTTHPKVLAVKYPSLKSHPDHELAKRQNTGYSGLMAIHLSGTLDDAKRFIGNLRLISSSHSLGLCSSVVSMP